MYISQGTHVHETRNGGTSPAFLHEAPFTYMECVDAAWIADTPLVDMRLRCLIDKVLAVCANDVRYEVW